MEKIKKSKGLKEQIHLLELEREDNGKRLKGFFGLSSDSRIKSSIDDNIIYSARTSLDLKSMLINSFVSLATEFLIKKLFTKKVFHHAKDETDLVVDIAIDEVIRRNSNGLSTEEKRLFKKMLHQYLVSK